MTTTIIGGRGDPALVQQRIAQLRAELESRGQTHFDKGKLRERMARLIGGVAVIKVGAPTETELRERRHRVEDAVQATRAARTEGILPGGGVALLNAQAAIDVTGLEPDEATGAEIVRRALEEPLRWIAGNAGFEPSVVVDRVRGLPPGEGLDAGTRRLLRPGRGRRDRPDDGDPRGARARGVDREDRAHGGVHRLGPRRDDAPDATRRRDAASRSADGASTSSTSRTSASSSPASATRRTSAIMIQHEHLHRYLFALGYCVGRRVVDVACGEGYGAAFLGEVRRGGRRGRLLGRGDRARDEGVRVARTSSSTPPTPRSIPSRTAHADVVVSFETIEHLEDQRGVPRRGRPDPAARRAAHPLDARPRGLRTAAEANPFHVRELDRAELTALLEAPLQLVRRRRPALGRGLVDRLSRRPVESPAGRVVLRPRRREQLPRLGRASGARLPDRARDERRAARGRPEHALRLALPAPAPRARLKELERDRAARVARSSSPTYARGAGARGPRREPLACASPCSPRSSRG